MKKTKVEKIKAIDNTNAFRGLDWIVLSILILLALVLRLYQIDKPIIDHHSWRQVDTAAVGRNFVKDGFDLLKPKYDDISSLQTGITNTQGLRMVEFPLYNAIFAGVYKYFPVMSLESTARIISILFSLFSLWAIYYLLLKEDSRISAFFGGLIFAVYPFFVFYSRVVLPDVASVSLVFLGILFLYFWKNSNGKNWFLFILSLILTALSILVKPMAIFYFLPLIYIFFLVYGFSFLKKFSFYFYFVMTIMPFIAWRWWIGQFPEGIPASGWLITSVATSEGMKEIFMRPAFFRWIFYERIANLILGGYSVALLIVGLMKRPKKSFLLLTMGISAMIYLLTFQGGNVQHDYYQIMILPTLAIFCGLGAGTIMSEKKVFLNSFFSVIVIFSVMTFSFLFSYNQVKEFYSYNENFVKITNAIKLLTEPDAKVVTDTMGDTTMLYNIDRKGYPAKYMDFPQMKTEGMNYFVTYNKSTADEAVAEGFEVVFENESFFLIKL